jgi:hypothetical protein
MKKSVFPKIADKDMDMVVKTLVLAVKVINPKMTDIEVEKLLQNVGSYLLIKSLRND